MFSVSSSGLGFMGAQRSLLSGHQGQSLLPTTHTHSLHAMGAQREAPTSEAEHCSGPTRWPLPRRKDSGRWAPSGQNHRNICPYSSCPSPEPKSHLHPPHSCILGLLPYMLCKISRRPWAFSSSYSSKHKECSQPNSVLSTFSNPTVDQSRIFF